MITHIKDPNSDKFIVFIHGLGGNSSTWLKFSKYLNKKWNFEFGFLLKYFIYYKNILDKDAILEKAKNKLHRFIIHISLFIPVNIFFVLKMLWSKRNIHNVNLLEKYINENCKDSKNIILVAHSMGGLIARQYLINCRKNKVDTRRFKMLVTYATPHKGSYRANIISIKSFKYFNIIYQKISDFFNYRISPQIGDLATLNDFIQKIDKDWTNYDLERKIIFIRVVAKHDKLVKRESAILHENDVENIFEFDYSHSSLINPKKNIDEFKPIDIFIKTLSEIEFEDEYFEEVDDEINYNENSEDLESY